jgi:predicted exporter
MTNTAQDVNEYPQGAQPLAANKGAEGTSDPASTDSTSGTTAPSDTLRPDVEILDVDNLDAFEKLDFRLSLSKADGDPLEQLLRQHALQFSRALHETLGMAGLSSDPLVRKNHLLFAMTLSRHVVMIHDGIRKHQGRGPQEYVVKHQTVAAASDARGRTRVVRRRPVTPAKRVAEAV